MVWAVLPLKPSSAAKQRLAGVLDPQQRRRLVRAMVGDVLEVLAEHPLLEQTVIVSNDPAVNALAAEFGVLHWLEPDAVANLSQAVGWAGETLAGQGVDAMLVVHGDLPLLSASDIDAMMAVHDSDHPGLTLVADRRQQGTNGLLVSPPGLIDFHYGDNSLQAHCQEAQRRGVTAHVLDLPGVAMDIDEPDDLYRLMGSTQTAANTAAALSQLAGEGLGHGEREAGVSGSPGSVVPSLQAILQEAAAGSELPAASCLQLADNAWCGDDDLDQLMSTAAAIRDSGFRDTVTYSRKIFIPLTHLCRDVCHYCTFARTPKYIDSVFLDVEEVVARVRQGLALGCREALFTLGEKPELRYGAAREALQAMGFDSTLDYLHHVADVVLRETGVLPHINAGNMDRYELVRLRQVSASMGIMLESASERLCQKGMPHYGSPDKDPLRRLATIARAGEARVPFTSGILIGIGESRRERIESLLALRELHRRYGHLQEIIIQNFRAKPDTKMAAHPEPGLDDLLWTIAVARLVFGAEMSIQAPPNLSPGVLPQLVAAGINDWGGVSPVTPDFVNPEAPWPHLDALDKQTALAGKQLQQRLTIYPRFAREAEQWLDRQVRPAVLSLVDAEGIPREDGWFAGESTQLPAAILASLQCRSSDGVSTDIRHCVAAARDGERLSHAQVQRLFEARGRDFEYVCAAADQQRRRVNGDTVSFVVNRNINYTNICSFKCEFCAFSKGKVSEELRGRPYDISLEEIQRRCVEAWQRGATEVCMQGGIHPRYDGNTYIDILRAVKLATPDMHIHAFSPLEVWQGARSLGLSLRDYLQRLRDEGLNTLPGTAAEILDDEIRAQICPDKLNTAEWLEVMRTAHQLGFKTTATMMFGHCDGYSHWARHLLAIRDLQLETNGFTEFVPLPFVAMEAPLYRRGKARRGPTLRESILVHAVARLVLSPAIANIQTSWVKMGEAGAQACLQAGANDLGGSLMNESITRAAGAEHGEEFSPQRLEAMIAAIGRTPRQRQTDYRDVSVERREAGRCAGALQPIAGGTGVIAAPAGDKSDRRSLIANG